jgi:hypothetical protein
MDNLRDVQGAREALLEEAPIMRDGVGIVAEIGRIYSGLVTRVARL